MSNEAFLSTSNMVKSLGGGGSTPDHAGAPDLLVGERGLSAPSPRTPSSQLALQASNLVAFGHSFHAP